MASRNIEDLHISIQDKARKLLRLCKFNGWEAFITAGYRDSKEQTELYAQGRTKPGKRVTNAKPGESLHQYGLAFDIAFRNKEGMTSWVSPLFLKAGMEAKWCGLEWGGNWLNFKDFPHFQYTGGLTLKQIQDGRRPYQQQVDMKKYEGKLVQDVEQTGSFGVVLDGKIHVATPERLPELLATYLMRKEGIPLSKEIWNNAEQHDL